MIPEKKYFSTGEAAKICAVTPDTVLKWVRKGKVPATRTPGGHHRIHRDAIISILKTRVGNRAPVPDGGKFRYCWEFHSDGRGIQKICRDCIVYRSRSGRCYEMVKLSDLSGNSRLYCSKSCNECDYYQLGYKQRAGILIVTDQGNVQSELKRQSDKTLYDVHFSDCEYKCSMLIESFRPDFILIDCSFDQERILAFARNLRADPRIPYARIILAGDTVDLPSECDQLIFALMSRPTNIKALQELIDSVKATD